jgi:predicted enzyme related to lactoylglutathione lyase
MQEIKSHPEGTFCWVDLVADDPDAIKEFYSKLFGWGCFNASEGTDMPPYYMFTINDKPVSAMYKKGPQQQGMPPHWMPYICTKDINSVLDKTKDAGGNAITDKIVVGDEGAMAMIQDNEGAFVALWEPGEHCGSLYKNVPGALSWVEHGSKRMSVPTPFYEKVFGWTSKKDYYPDMAYTLFMKDGEMVAGMYEMPDELKDVPPHWMPYFLIENIDETIKTAQQSGGGIKMPKAFVKGVGHFSVIADPQGAVFGVIQPDMEK